MIKRSLIQVGWSERLITTQKVQRLQNKITNVTKLVTTPAINTKAT